MLTISRGPGGYSKVDPLCRRIAVADTDVLGTDGKHVDSISNQLTHRQHPVALSNQYLLLGVNNMHCDVTTVTMTTAVCMLLLALSTLVDNLSHNDMTT